MSKMIEQESTDSWGKRLFRIGLIVGLFNLICASIAYITNYIGKTFEYQQWNITTWWLFISIYIMLGAYMLYKIPFLDRWLAEKLDYQIKKLEQSKEERLGAKKQVKQEKREIKQQTKEEFRNQTRTYGGNESE